MERKCQSTTKISLTFVRHGQSEGNQNGLLQVCETSNNLFSHLYLKHVYSNGILHFINSFLIHLGTGKHPIK
jgi:hypothetical protein